ncbi:MAG: radical SAM protein [Bryobacteraceae bacterium]|nr:radical SAM protein [Bryobacteraceae bacterium]
MFPELSPSAGLIGIAKLAADAPVLEAKSRVEYRDLENRTLIGRVGTKRPLPFDHTINPYRGCEYGCKYCYARYTHEFMELRETEQFETLIFAKHFEPHAFRRELAKIPHSARIAIGTATDPYQPAERRYRITQQILSVFQEDRGRHVSITSKSDLIPRDSSLLVAVGQRNDVHILQTITTMDAALARILEPYAPRPDLRIECVRKLSEAGIRVTVMNSPVLPLLNDSRESLAQVAAAGKAAGASYFVAQPLFLKPCAREAFFPMLEQQFPHLVRRYRERYARESYLKGAYPEMLAERVRSVREEYGLTNRHGREALPDLWPEKDQLTLFEA